jgi:DNA mismatch repair protein MutS
MQIDNTTFNDLSIFHKEEEFSIFHKLNFTQTTGGREWLIRFFSEPLFDIKKITEIQDILKCVSASESQWPLTITNGTIMVMERFYESPVDTIPDAPNLLNALSYKILHTPDYSLVRYTVGHFADFVRGFRDLVALFDNNQTPLLLRSYIQRAAGLINHEVMLKLTAVKKGVELSALQTIYFGNYIRYRFKNAALELIDIFGRLDAWYSMGKAISKFNLSYPRFIDSAQSALEAKGLYHILLPEFLISYRRQYGGQKHLYKIDRRRCLPGTPGHGRSCRTA